MLLFIVIIAIYIILQWKFKLSIQNYYCIEGIVECSLNRLAFVVEYDKSFAEQSFHALYFVAIVSVYVDEINMYRNCACYYFSNNLLL